jgi:hypothetical protein
MKNLGPLILILIGIVIWIVYSIITGLTKQEAEVVNFIKRNAKDDFDVWSYLRSHQQMYNLSKWSMWKIERRLKP